jgi:hypothetical protein
MALVGDGTLENPYQISTVNDLVQVPSYDGVGKHFKLMNDIQLPYRDSRFPLSSFSGVFDGNGKKFTGLDIYLNTTNYVGLFSYISNATFKNLGFKSCSVLGKEYIGMVAGDCGSNVVFENCYIDTCFVQTYAPSGISGYSYAGGFVGRATSPITFRNCFVRNAVIKAISYVGGFVAYGNGHTFERCYSYLNSNCFAKTGGIGAFAPTQTSGHNTSTSYYVSVAGANGQGATLVTDTQLKNPANLPNLDFNNVWIILPDENQGYPIQRVFVKVPTAESRNISSFMKAISTSTWVDLIIPLTQLVEVGSFMQPITTSTFAELIQVIRQQINVVSQMSKINTNIDRKVKAVQEILSYMNKITGQAIITSNIEPQKLIALAKLLENGNEVAVLQYLLNDVYVNETRNDVQYQINRTSTHQITAKTEVRIVAYTGDTVRLKVNFKTYDGNAIDPTDVKLKIYKPTTNSYELISTIQLSPANKVGVGEYQYDYVIPEDLINSGVNFLVYEFSGLYNGSTTLARDKIDVRFV